MQSLHLAPQTHQSLSSPQSLPPPPPPQLGQPYPHRPSSFFTTLASYYAQVQQSCSMLLSAHWQDCQLFLLERTVPKSHLTFSASRFISHGWLNFGPFISLLHMTIAHHFEQNTLADTLHSTKNFTFSYADNTNGGLHHRTKEADNCGRPLCRERPASCRESGKTGSGPGEWPFFSLHSSVRATRFHNQAVETRHFSGRLVFTSPPASSSFESKQSRATHVIGCDRNMKKPCHFVVFQHSPVSA